MARLRLPGPKRQDLEDAGQSTVARLLRRAGLLAVGLVGLQAASASGPIAPTGYPGNGVTGPVSASPSPAPSLAPLSISFPSHTVPLAPPSPSPSPLPPNLVLTPNATWHSSTHYWDSNGATWYCPPFGLDGPYNSSVTGKRRKNGGRAAPVLVMDWLAW
jgi:hypothetical protein